jgi:hypothetical protein
MIHYYLLLFEKGKGRERGVGKGCDISSPVFLFLLLLLLWRLFYRQFAADIQHSGGRQPISRGCGRSLGTGGFTVVNTWFGRVWLFGSSRRDGVGCTAEVQVVEGDGEWKAEGDEFYSTR